MADDHAQRCLPGHLEGELTEVARSTFGRHGLQRPVARCSPSGGILAASSQERCPQDARRASLAGEPVARQRAYWPEPEPSTPSMTSAAFRCSSGLTFAYTSAVIASP